VVSKQPGEHAPGGDGFLPVRGINAGRETVRYWWNRFGPIFTAP